MRPSRRAPDELRPVSLERGVVKYAEGSCMVKFGDTHVLVTATLEERLPPWLKGQGRGWVTAEYGMLPRATLERTRREAAAGKQGGRTVEIQRLIGRSLRAAVDLEALGERQITVDCDVIQADGGTRTASITGAWVALADCIGWMKTRNMLKTNVLRDNVAAISCGIYNGTPVLDLDYAEDSEADTDANFVMTGDGRIIEVQGTAEKTPFSQDEFLALMALARKGVARLVDLQKMAVHASVSRVPGITTLPKTWMRQPGHDGLSMLRQITGKLVIATHNPGKLAEMRELLAPHGVEAVSAGELGLGEPEETGADVSGQCARSRRSPRRKPRRLPAFADDSGLVVDALDGAPGIYSARWAGESKDFMAAMTRIERLLQERGATAPGQAQGAFRFRAVRRLARRPSRRGRGARRRHAGVAAARHRRIRLRSGVPARRTHAHLRRDDQHREARPAAAGLGLSHRARAFVKLAEICLG